MPIARGNFEVRVVPSGGGPAGLGHMNLDKDFTGDIVGTSVGEMLSAGNPADGTAAYVALEQITGTLHGKSGSFWLSHRASLVEGTGHMEIVVVPGLSTGELTGMTGSLVIDVENNHAYEFDYLLPD